MPQTLKRFATATIKKRQWQLNIGRLNEDKELFTSLEFNMVSVNPLT